VNYLRMQGGFTASWQIYSKPFRIFLLLIQRVPLMSHDANKRRTVFYISDGTGITAENLGHSLISQFDNVEFEHITLPYVDTPDKAETAVAQINHAAVETGERPIVFVTLVNDELRKIVSKVNGLYIDIFNTFIGPLEKELKAHSSYTIGRGHGLPDESRYKARIDAIDFTLSTDDGSNPHRYSRADIILVGVSRSGKTPTCLYLAMQRGLLAANYPITEDDLKNSELPKVLQPYKNKLFGLTIDPVRLQEIRAKRRPDTQYADVDQCSDEVRKAERWFNEYQIPYISTTALSIEEIATKILAQTGLRQRAL
jgi:[pyruvate, water dikinase]-phosphate phosphotransferase / [pyruvate, water dikinase] kinase